MMRRLDHLFSAIALLLCSITSAQRSPFNGLEVHYPDPGQPFRMVIGGHFHGESSNHSGYPAATLLANLDTINALGANIFLSTGDLFMDAEKDRPRYERAFFSKLKVPFFNAPGNHDGDKDRMAGWLMAITNTTPSIDSSAVVESYRAKVVSPVIGQVIILDTETKDGSITDKQKNVLEACAGLPELGELFIFSHRPIWAEGDPVYDGLFRDNTRSLTGTNFHKEIYPILQNMARRGHVHWISGSLGGQAPASIFFQPHAAGINYIQCAIRNELRDALLIADIYPGGVKWSALSLTDQELQAPEAYDAVWWQKHIGADEDFNWRLLPYLVKTTVMRTEFWWGVLAGVLVLILVRRFWRRS